MPEEIEIRRISYRYAKQLTKEFLKNNPDYLKYKDSEEKISEAIGKIMRDRLNEEPLASLNIDEQVNFDAHIQGAMEGMLESINEARGIKSGDIKEEFEAMPEYLWATSKDEIAGDKIKPYGTEAYRRKQRGEDINVDIKDLEPYDMKEWNKGKKERFNNVNNNGLKRSFAMAKSVSKSIINKLYDIVQPYNGKRFRGEQAQNIHNVIQSIVKDVENFARQHLDVFIEDPVSRLDISQYKYDMPEQMRYPRKTYYFLIQTIEGYKNIGMDIEWITVDYDSNNPGPYNDIIEVNVRFDSGGSIKEASNKISPVDAVKILKDKPGFISDLVQTQGDMGAIYNVIIKNLGVLKARNYLGVDSMNSFYAAADKLNRNPNLKNADILKSVVKIANYLDECGMKQDADIVDKVMIRIAAKQKKLMYGDLGSSIIRELEMTMDLGSDNNLGIVQQFFRDLKTYGLDEAIIYVSQFEAKGEVKKGTTDKLRATADRVRQPAVKNQGSALVYDEDFTVKMDDVLWKVEHMLPRIGKDYDDNITMVDDKWVKDLASYSGIPEDLVYVWVVNYWTREVITDEVKNKAKEIIDSGKVRMDF